MAEPRKTLIPPGWILVAVVVVVALAAWAIIATIQEPEVALRPSEAPFDTAPTAGTTAPLQAYFEFADRPASADPGTRMGLQHAYLRKVAQRMDSDQPLLQQE